MKRQFSGVFLAITLLVIQSPCLAIKLVPSVSNLRFNDATSSVSFTVSLDDDISSLQGTGTINAKLKLDSKLFTTNLTGNTVAIPYTNGVIGNSPEIVVSLVNPTINKSLSSSFSFKFSGSQRKKLKLENYSDSFHLDAEALEVSGRVTIPAGDSDSFRARTKKKLMALRARGIAPFNTDNPEGVVVELVPINPETGEASGEAVASAVTDDQGNYEMEIPAESDFGTGYALVVENDAGGSMHAPLFGDQVDINPGSETLHQLIQEAVVDPTLVGLGGGEQISFENFTDLEAANLNAKMQDLNPLYEETLDESVVSLKDSYASFLNNMLGFSADDDSTGEETELGDAVKGVAGNYNVVFFNSGIATNDRTSISVELASARMAKPDAVGALTVTPFPSFSTQAMLNEKHEQHHESGGDGPGCEGPDCGCQGPECDGGEHNPGGDFPGGDQGDNSGNPNQPSQRKISPKNEEECYELEAETSAAHEVNGADEAGNFYMSIDANRIISFAEPASEQSFESPGGTSYYRTLPGVMHMIPVGDDMFLSSSIFSGISISSDGTEEYDYQPGFGSIIKKSELTESDLEGAYGMVGLGYGLGSSSFSVRSFVGGLDFSGSTSVTYTLEDSYTEAFATACGGDSFNLTSGSEEGSGTASLEFLGDRVSISVADDDPSSATLFTGFARSDAEILTLVYANDSGAKGSRIGFDGRSRNVIEGADRQMIFAVRKPTSLVNLAGKTYRLLSMNFTLNEQGGRIIESGDSGTLTFADATAAITGFTKAVYTKSTASAVVETSTEAVNQAAIAYTLASDGAIALTVGAEEWEGFVSSDASLIIFNVSEPNGTGMYLGILQ